MMWFVLIALGVMAIAGMGVLAGWRLGLGSTTFDGVMSVAEEAIRQDERQRCDADHRVRMAEAKAKWKAETAKAVAHARGQDTSRTNGDPVGKCPTCNGYVPPFDFDGF